MTRDDSDRYTFNIAAASTTATVSPRRRVSQWSSQVGQQLVQPLPPPTVFKHPHQPPVWRQQPQRRLAWDVIHLLLSPPVVVVMPPMMMV